MSTGTIQIITGISAAVILMILIWRRWSKTTK